jgi:peptidoglycan/LPS O-acetylase OafA/YrhL
MILNNRVLIDKKFYPEIESLRGIAAFWVVILHIDWTFPGSNSPFVRNGYLMVDFFFILSGFVMIVNYHDKINKAKDF